LSKEDFEQRQRLLQELETFRSKEQVTNPNFSHDTLTHPTQELLRQKELNDRELRIQQERLREKEDQMNNRSLELEKYLATAIVY
jgi:hypothetical protein